jgi:C-methyltransferase
MTVTRASVNEMMRAYKRTSLLRTAVELGVFDAVHEGAGTAAAVAERAGADPRGMRILLDALAAVGLLTADGERYALAEGAADVLVSSAPGYLGDMTRVVVSRFEWDSLGRLADAVRNGGTVEEQNAETPGFAYWETFAEFASAVTLPTAAVMGDLLEPWAAGHDPLSILDVACGHGLYGFTLARRFQQARVTGLDWDNVLPITEKHAVELGVHDRTGFIAGDMFEVDYQGPHDLVLVTNVLHHFDEQRCTELLTRAAQALRPGGRLGVVSFVRDGSPAEDPEPYLFSILMLSWTAAGEVHSQQAHHDMITAAGFTNIVQRQVPGLPFHVLVAERA